MTQITLNLYDSDGNERSKEETRNELNVTLNDNPLWSWTSSLDGVEYEILQLEKRIFVNRVDN